MNQKVKSGLVSGKDGIGPGQYLEPEREMLCSRRKSRKDGRKEKWGGEEERKGHGYIFLPQYILLFIELQQRKTHTRLM